ncbi:MAG: transcription elongation factor NusA [Nitrososphaeraceae archaeon]
MKTPICTFDAKTGILCAKCETKLRLGHLKQADVEGAIKITKLAEHNQDINKFTMVGAAKVDGDFVLILRGSDISVLRANTMLPTKFEHEFQSKVWFVEAEATDKRFIENLFFPLRVLTVNLIWLPDGNKLTRVIIAGKSNNSESKTTIEKIKKIAKEIRNIELLVEFE